MEFVGGLASAGVSAAVSAGLKKLGELLLSEKLEGDAKREATYIKDDLRAMQEIIKGSPLPSECIAPLWRLAYEIEDCIARSKVKKKGSDKEFAKEIAQLQKICAETRQKLKDYIEMLRGLQELAAQRHGQGQQAAPVDAFEVLVPHEYLAGKQVEDWLSCTLYFYMFPHDHPARRNPLIRRWLAEGFVKREADAVKYLKALINDNIINTTARMMKRCQPPQETLSRICQHSRDTNFMVRCDGMGMTNLEKECARRVSVHPNDDILDDIYLPSHLHTLAVFHGSSNPEIYETTVLEFGKYEVLRVLDLKECAPLSEGHLLAICKLLLLKYLSFQGGNGTDRLPREIENLEWLETLDMRGSETVTVHKEVLMMPKLTHLLGKFQLSRTDTISATVLGWMRTELGKFLKQKSVLQTLSGFVTGERLGFPQLMILMRKLRKVKIWCKANASESNLGYIARAITEFIPGSDGMIQDPGRSLSIDFHECSRAGQYLNNIKVQGGVLNSLKLHGNLSEFPQFVAELRGVEELCLSSTALSWNVILSGLRDMKILKYLKLVEDNLGHVEILPDDLKGLERLSLVCEPNLDITIQAGALPRLVSLHLICQDLDVVLPGTHGEIVHITHPGDVGLHSQLGQAIQQELMQRLIPIRLASSTLSP